MRITKMKYDFSCSKLDLESHKVEKHLYEPKTSSGRLMFG